MARRFRPFADVGEKDKTDLTLPSTSCKALRGAPVARRDRFLLVGDSVSVLSVSRVGDRSAHNPLGDGDEAGVV